MIIISILFWKIKYTWAKFLKAVLFGDVSIFFKKKKQFKNVNFIAHIYFPRLLFFPFFGISLCALGFPHIFTYVELI